MLSHVYNIVIRSGVGVHRHGKDVVYGLNATGKSFLLVLMTTVQFPGAATSNSQITMHTSISNTDISIAGVFQKMFQTQHMRMV